MKLGKGFNIGTINELLLDKCYKEILDHTQINLINKVSIFFSSIINL